MDQCESDKRIKTAKKLTVISAIVLLLGGFGAWLIAKDGSPEALGAIMPLMLVGGTHLFTGPIAIFQLHKARKHRKSWYIYFYFVLFLIVTFQLFPPDILGYIFFFLICTIVPILVSLLIAVFKNTK